MQLNLEDQRIRQARMVWEAPTANVDASSRGIQMLHSLNVVPHGQYISTELAKKHDYTLSHAATAKLPIQFLGYAPAFDGTKVYQGIGTDWALMNISTDPILQQHNKYPMPRVVLRSIRQAIKTGMDFDAIFVAHEIPAGYAHAGISIPYELIMPPPPHRTLQRLRYLDQVISIFHALTTFVVATPIMAVSFATAILQYDPILFGLHIDRQNYIQNQPFAMWYYLTHWTWD